MKTSVDTYCSVDRPRVGLSRGLTGLLLTLGLLLSGCGKIGDPLPPIPRSRLLIEDLQVSQVGARLVLTFPLVRTRQTQRIARIDIYRLIEAEREPLALPAEIYESRASIIASLPADQIPLNRSAVTYVDPLDPLQMKGMARGVRYRYAVRVIDATGTGADLSNYGVIHPLADVAAAPTNLQSRQLEKQIILTWSAPESKATGPTGQIGQTGQTEKTPVNVAGYHIYRRTAGSDAPAVRLNDQPLIEPRFVDQAFQFGLSYEYTVRAISRQPGAGEETADPSRPAMVESDESPLLVHQAQDTFAPAAPTLVTIASINKAISLFWPLNTESDIAGYHLYRAEEQNGQPVNWRRINTQLHQTGTWRDERVVLGRTYFYQITAVDRFGNESAKSAPVSETVNP
jgi:hypothetical protein